MSSAAAPPTAARSAADPDLSGLAAIVAAHLPLEGPLLPILHAVQAEYGFIPQGALDPIAAALNITKAEVHGVVSFYPDFRDAPAGRRVVRICRAEACQAMGAPALADTVLRALDLDGPGTAQDGRITVEPVYCLGLCATAPAAMVDGRPMGRVTARALLAEAAA